MIKQRRVPQGTLVPTDVAALALGITPGGVRLMAHRGQLRQYGTPRRRLYDLAELMERQRIERTENPCPATTNQARPSTSTPDPTPAAASSPPAP